MAIRSNLSGDYLERTAGLWDYNAAYTALVAFRHTGNATWQPPITIGRTADNNYDGIYLGGTNYFALYVNDNESTNFTAATANTWYWGVLRRNSATSIDGRFYNANGTLIESVNSTIDVSARAAAQSFRLCQNTYYTDFLDGRVMCCKVWTRALSNDEIAAELRQLEPVSWNGLWGYFPIFDTNRANDRSGFGRNFTENGTLTNEAPLALPWGISHSDIGYYSSGGGGSNVTPGNANAATQAVAPTAVRGSVTVTPGNGSAATQAVAPGVVRGSVSVTPGIVSAATQAVAPTPVRGSISITPGIVSSATEAVAPSVLRGSVTVTPANANVATQAVAPAVVRGSVSVTPGVVSAATQAVAPTVDVGSGNNVTPGVASAGTQSVAPTVVRGSVSVTPSAASVSTRALVLQADEASILIITHPVLGPVFHPVRDGPP